MILYNFDEIICRKNTNCVKWDFIEVGYESFKTDILPLSIADMDFPCAKPILEVLKKRVDKNFLDIVYLIPMSILVL